ncbi:hypothetical protein FFF34_002765 [Inquilinus sp. KBS0705]|nr:hypothetical protein FFF34_002765 [Inquilinus sp. KBS0705]
MMDDYKKKLGSLADKIRNDTWIAPVQQVTEVKPPPAPEAEAARFNNWIPKSLKKRVKAYGVQQEMSQKDITIQALMDYLEKKENH